jgi:peptidoglycan/xylan/chitin deacetylase (PgdA/CDA1 family)
MGLRCVDFGDRRNAVIPRFHSISDTASGNYLYAEPAICVPPGAFERQIAFLAQNYRCVSMDDLLEALESGRALPRNAVVVTFDDGYRDNYEVAYPVLRRHRVPAIFYLATASLDGGEPLWPSEIRYLVYSAADPTFWDPLSRQQYDIRSRREKEEVIRQVKRRLVTLPRQERNDVVKELRARSKADPRFLRTKMLSWKDVKEMHRAGMHFGAHTVSHPLLTAVPPEEAREEIAASRAEIEAELKAPVRHFSYPNPGDGVHCNAAVKRLVAETGYMTAVTSRQGYVTGDDDPLELPRVGVGRAPRGTPWYLEKDALRLLMTHKGGHIMNTKESAR